MKKKKYIKGQHYHSIVTIEKVKKDVPTVIIFEGKRYVYEPSDKWR